MNLFNTLDQLGREASSLEGLTYRWHPENRQTLLHDAARLTRGIDTTKQVVPTCRTLPSWEQAILFQKTYLIRDRLDRALANLRKRTGTSAEIAAIAQTLRHAHQLDEAVQDEYCRGAA
jgi:hypothetical protein